MPPSQTETITINPSPIVAAALQQQESAPIATSAPQTTEAPTAAKSIPAAEAATAPVQQVSTPTQAQTTHATPVAEAEPTLQQTNGNLSAAPVEQAPAATESEKTEIWTHKEPLKLSGILDQYKSFDVTPVIGREYSDVNLVDWLRAENSDELIRDLAITSKFFTTRPSSHIADSCIIVSQRGVVFFRAQDDLTNELQKELIQKIGELSGKPKTSKLHIHPVSNSGRDLGGKDDEISVISSEQAKKLYKNRFLNEKKQNGRGGWHSDITFEPIPSDYAILRLTQLPATGGGTYCFSFSSSSVLMRKLGD